MIAGELASRGVSWSRHHVARALREIDPVGTAVRAAGCIHRRVYDGRYPGYILHYDGNMKLIRWKIVISGAVDGYSRRIVWLRAADNNFATTTLTYFLDAVQRLGPWSLYRCDKGGENTLVTAAVKVMNDRRGDDGVGQTAILGTSVHNVRIERLWRDVVAKVVKRVSLMLERLEAAGDLNVDNPLHIFVVHCVDLPVLDRLLEEFVRMWNYHVLRTEGTFDRSVALRGRWPPHSLSRVCTVCPSLESCS